MLKALYKFYYDNEYEKDLSVLIEQHKRRRSISSNESPPASSPRQLSTSSDGSFNIPSIPSPFTTPTRNGSRIVPSSPSASIHEPVSLLSAASMLSLIIPSSSTPSFPALLDGSFHSSDGDNSNNHNNNSFHGLSGSSNSVAIDGSSTGSESLTYEQVRKEIASHMLIYQKLSSEGGRKIVYSHNSNNAMNTSSNSIATGPSLTASSNATPLLNSTSTLTSSSNSISIQSSTPIIPHIVHTAV